MARRIASDFKLISTQPPDGVRLVSQNTLTEWKCEIDGPKDTIWESGTFELQINFPSEYPFKPPVIKFLTPMYHPNISTKGGICLDVLLNNWVPSFNISSILVSIRSFLDDPNPDHGLNNEALEVFRKNKELYKENVKRYINKYAKKK